MEELADEPSWNLPSQWTNRRDWLRKPAVRSSRMLLFNVDEYGLRDIHGIIGFCEYPEEKVWSHTCQLPASMFNTKK